MINKRLLLLDNKLHVIFTEIVVETMWITNVTGALLNSWKKLLSFKLLERQSIGMGLPKQKTNIQREISPPHPRRPSFPSSWVVEGLLVSYVVVLLGSAACHTCPASSLEPTLWGHKAKATAGHLAQGFTLPCLSCCVLYPSRILTWLLSWAMISSSLLSLVCCSFLTHPGKAASLSPGVPAQQGCCSCPANIQDMLLLFTVQLCLTFHDPVDCSTAGFPVLHYLPEVAQTHVCWVDNAISSSVTRFSRCPPSFSASGSFPMSWLFSSGGQSIGASASASVLPMNIQGWFLLGWTGLVSLLSKECYDM